VSDAFGRELFPALFADGLTDLRADIRPLGPEA
jgi:hypothetical protein